MDLAAYQFFLRTKVLFQPGAARDFSNELNQLALKKVFIVCDPFFAKNGLAQTVKEGIEAAGVEVVGIYSDVPPNSELKTVEACASQARTAGAEGIVVLGGGSAIDTAKAANILLSLGGDLVNDYSGTQTISQELKPLIAIPTTAGTGSEVTSSAVIYDAVNRLKLSFNDSHLVPTLALLDPELTLTVPPQITAMTGMDAMTHSIEAVTSLQANPMSEALALQAIEMLRKNLLATVRDGSDLEGRGQLMAAANMAGIAFDHAMVGVIHAMSHATGGIAHVPHGMANSIFLPYGMEYNLEVAAAGYARMAPAFGIAVSGDENADARAVIQAVRDLRRDLHQACGLPQRLSEAGVKESDLNEIARNAVDDGTSFFNPREVTEEGVLAKIREAY